jgi:hypothetical protein
MQSTKAKEPAPKDHVEWIQRTELIVENGEQRRPSICLGLALYRGHILSFIKESNNELLCFCRKTGRAFAGPKVNLTKQVESGGATTSDRSGIVYVPKLKAIFAISRVSKALTRLNFTVCKFLSNFFVVWLVISLDIPHLFFCLFDYYLFISFV